DSFFGLGGGCSPWTAPPSFLIFSGGAEKYFKLIKRFCNYSIWHCQWRQEPQHVAVVAAGEQDQAVLCSELDTTLGQGGVGFIRVALLYELERDHGAGLAHFQHQRWEGGLQRLQTLGKSGADVVGALNQLLLL